MHSDIGDHLHEGGINSNNRAEAICQFPYDEVFRDLDGEEPEDSVTFADMGSALALILQWVCGTRDSHRPRDINLIAARSLTLLLWLAPDQCEYESLADIARFAGCTRAALSAALVCLKSQSGCLASMGKGWETRRAFSEAQFKSVANGTHSSRRRRDRKA